MAHSGRYVVQANFTHGGWEETGNLHKHGGPYFDHLETAQALAGILNAENGMEYRAVDTKAVVPRWQFVQSVVDKVEFPDYLFKVINVEDHDNIFVQGEYWEADTVTGKPELQKTRRWLIESKDTEDEIVRTLFKLVMTSMEHKAREWFKYEGYSVMNPHFSVQQYLGLMKAGK
jgi:hypothetical protein